MFRPSNRHGGRDCSQWCVLVVERMDVAQAAQHNGHTLHAPDTTYWSDNRVSSVGGSFSSAAVRAGRWRRSVLPPTLTPLCARGGDSSSEWQCIMHMLCLICTLISCLEVKIQFLFEYSSFCIYIYFVIMCFVIDVNCCTYVFI